jgi:hypothetical protein
MAARLRSGQQFILPITTVIETGNFIAQIPRGDSRRACAIRMAELLRLICQGRAPWVLHDVAWNRDFLERFLDGADTQVGYVQHAVSQLSAGDLCLLTERHHYHTRTSITARIWTLDAGLAAHN